MKDPLDLELKDFDPFNDKKELDGIEEHMELGAFMVGMLSGLRKCGVISDDDVGIITQEHEKASGHFKNLLKAMLLIESCEEDEDVEKAKEALGLCRRSIEELADMVGPVALESGAFQQFTMHFNEVMRDLKDPS